MLLPGRPVARHRHRAVGVHHLSHGGAGGHVWHAQTRLQDTPHALQRAVGAPLHAPQGGGEHQTFRRVFRSQSARFHQWQEIKVSAAIGYYCIFIFLLLVYTIQYFFTAFIFFIVSIHYTVYI